MFPLICNKKINQNFQFQRAHKKFSKDAIKILNYHVKISLIPWKIFPKKKWEKILKVFFNRIVEKYTKWFYGVNEKNRWTFYNDHFISLFIELSANFNAQASRLMTAVDDALRAFSWQTVCESSIFLIKDFHSCFIFSHHKCVCEERS
jgi:hypothetical protein